MNKVKKKEKKKLIELELKSYNEYFLGHSCECGRAGQVELDKHDRELQVERDHVGLEKSQRVLARRGWLQFCRFVQVQRVGERAREANSQKRLVGNHDFL